MTCTSLQAWTHRPQRMHAEIPDDEGVHVLVYGLLGFLEPQRIYAVPVGKGLQGAVAGPLAGDAVVVAACQEELGGEPPRLVDPFRLGADVHAVFSRGRAAATRDRAPVTSTRQIRQAPVGVQPFR